MKEYQVNLLLRLRNSETVDELNSICSEICADDTGDYSEISIELSKKILELNTKCT